jgi:two-component system, OmpR family, response regulator ChvI
VVGTPISGRERCVGLAPKGDDEMGTIVTDCPASFETGKAAGHHPHPLSAAISQVLLVEDGHLHWDAAEAELVQEGLVVHLFKDWQAMLAAATEGLCADLVVLGGPLETILAVDLLSQMRSKGFNWPVMFLPAYSSPPNERLPLQRGAGDFVGKVRCTATLAARLLMIANQRRIWSNLDSDDVVHCGRLTLHARGQRAFWDNVDVGLTMSEFKIVQLLASNAGSFITYRQIYDQMHHVGFIAGSGKDGYRVNVRSAISRIREKFRGLSCDFNEIRTYPSFGYCWGKAQAPNSTSRG